MSGTNHSTILGAPARGFLARQPAERPSGPPVRAGLGRRRWRSLLEALEQRRERARIRRVLAALDDRLLHDIGLSRADVGPELPAPFPGLGEPLTPDPAAASGRSLREAQPGLWHL